MYPNIIHMRKSHCLLLCQIMSMPSFLLMIIVVIMRQNIVNGNVGMIVDVIMETIMDVNVNTIMETIMDTIMDTIVETRLIASLRGQWGQWGQWRRWNGRWNGRWNTR